MSDNSLTVIEHKKVNFYGDALIAVLVEGGGVYVPIRPICDRLGIQWAAQSKRINRDEILSEVKGVSIMDTPGGRQKMTCLPIEYLNGWLFGLTLSKIKPTLRDSLKRYKRDCYRVLSEAFLENRVTHRPDTVEIEELLKHGDSPSAVAYRHAMAIANLARQQLIQEVQIDQHGERLDSAELRLSAIEAELGNPDRFITIPQAEQLSQAVRAIGLVFSKTTGRNEYGGVHGELYRRYSINSYKRLPAAKFESAMGWLRDWYEQLTDEASAPF